MQEIVQEIVGDVGCRHASFFKYTSGKLTGFKRARICRSFQVLFVGETGSGQVERAIYSNTPTNLIIIVTSSTRVDLQKHILLIS